MKKKYLLVLCAILFLISITGVWASEDVNQTLSAETPDTLASDMNTADEIGLSENEEVLRERPTLYVNSSSSSGDGSYEHPFNNLKDAIENSWEEYTIMIAPGTYSGEKNTGLTIEKNNLNLIKYGEGEAIFDGQHNTGIWTVAAKSITIKGLTFQNGESNSGGALYFSTHLINSNIDATFINNTAQQDGGAIFFWWHVINTNITGTYIGNTAQNGHGGANYFYDTLTNVTINGNYTQNTAQYGGANAFWKTLNHVNINGNYNNNTAKNDGGANYFLKTLTNTTINGNYNNNKAQDHGGANCFDSELTDTIINGNYTQNTAQESSGGANHFQNTLTNTTINGNYNNNTAGYDGGANFFGTTLTNTTINGNYNNNKAQQNGGANHFQSTLTDVKINANFTNNTARDEYYMGSGGANFFIGKLNNVEITGEYNRNNAYWDGGANYFDNSITNVKINANFNRNTARHSGGANNFNGDLNNVNITGNYTLNQVNLTREQTYGGGANNFNKTLTNVKITGDYNHNKVNGEYYNGDGGANNFRDTLTNIEITGNYTGNTAENTGGANNFYSIANNVTITGNYTGNTAGALGGANNFYELNNVTINGSYSNNQAAEGGANSFNSIANNVTIKGDYTSNQAYLGGANCFYSATTNLNIIGNYANNTAEYDGGANHFFGVVENANITGNYTSNQAKGEGNFGKGGANFFLDSLTNVNIIGNYNNNTITKNGGANYFKGSLNRVNIIGNYTNNRENANIYLYEKTSYHEKASSYGGGANYFMDSLTDVNITGNYKNNQVIINATFDNCHHTLDPNKLENILTTDYNGGGANYFKNTLTNVNINGNYADNLAVINASYINNVVFKMENSYNGGGANYFYGGLNNVNITGTYENNKAGINTKYSNNKYEESGNRYNGAGANHFMATLTNVTLNANFTGNQVNGSDEDMIGGANSFAGMLDHVEIKGNYDRNTAQTYGGANIFQKSLTFVNITGNYMGNIARDGGANYLHDTLNQVTITGNYTGNIAFGQYSENGGGANYFHEVLENVTIAGNYTGNTAQKNGGANNFLNALTNVNITGNYNNNTANYGGANRFQSTLNQVTITGNYNNNTASLYGGANNFNRALSNVNITGNYNNNKAEHSGGANYFRITITNITITGNYTGNTAQFSGGANHFLNTLTNVEINGNYANNTAQSNGGANHFLNTLTNVEINGNYANNTAQNSGGANNFQKTLNQVTITGNYNNNKAMKGWGGANNFQETLNQITITGNYNNNTASLHGGANYFNKAITNVNITGNYINNTGNEAIYIYNAKSDILIHDSIFINQKINIIYGSLEVRDTWFGNNATNYNETPNVGKHIDLINWLFLNATADPISLAISDTSKIQFKLYSYNSTGTFDYDNSKLSPVNLTITATNGNVNPTVKLGENITYTATGIGTKSVTGSIENVFYTIKLNNGKADSKLSVDPQEVYYSNNTAIALSYNSTATGKVNITLTGKKHNKNYENQTLNNTITLKDNILPDEYTITVTYSGDKNFQNATAYGNLTVKSLDSNMKVTGHTINVTDTNGVLFTVTLPENATGKLNISNKSTINVAESGIKKNNNLIIDIENAAYPVGTYNWTFTYYDDDIYTDSTINATANILIIKTQITPTNKTINLTVGDASKITYTINPANAVGNITFKSSNPNIANIDTKGNIKATGYGSAVITVKFEGCENYTPSNANISLNIAKAQSTLDINGTSIYFGEDAILNYTTINATGIEVTITDWRGNPLTEGVDYNITVTDTQIILKFFDDGTYTLNATTKTDTNHIPTAKDVSVNVNPICDLEVVLTPMNATANYGDTVKWNATIINHGPSYPYNVYIDAYAPEGLIFDSHDAYVSSNHYSLKIPFTLSPNIPLSVFIKTIVNVSSANLTLNVSVHDEYFPDPNPNNNNANATVEIIYATAEVNITANSKITFGDNLVANIELPSDAEGNITASVNGKNYTQEVKDGKATITIPKLDAGDKTVNITYSGDKKYKPAEKTLEVNVKKATPKITAKAKTFKTTTKTKKYTITLKDNKGKAIKNAKVYLKVNGKTYTAKTNSKGKATFKITKLNKKGKYKATITYKGNKKYTKATKKVKLTVKPAWKTISKGSKDYKTVKKIQKALKKNGYYISYKGRHLMVDGIYHDCTQRAVKQFQKAKGLKVTGKVDEKTAKKLKLI